MILDEPILTVFELQYRESYLSNWHNAYLHTTGELEYHVTEGYWILLESENYYVTIGYDGAQKYQKPYTFPSEKYDWWYNGDDEYIDWRETLFSGQKIHCIEKKDDYQVICFDDFNLNLYIYNQCDNMDVFYGTKDAGVNVVSVGGHLVKKCSCGGKAEILSDIRGDFAVRCNSCHKATYIDMVLKEQIDAWNNDDSPCFIETGEEELYDLLKSKRKIKYIALDSNPYGFESIDETLCFCKDAIIAFDDALFGLSSQKIEGNNCGFSGEIYSDYNRDFWSNVINAESDLCFIDEEKDHEGQKALRFKLDDAELLIEATPKGLCVSIDKVQLSTKNAKRKKLFV